MSVVNLEISAAALAQRGRPYEPLVPPPGSCYDHAGHARWYGGPDRRGYLPRLIVLHTTESPTATLLDSLSYDARRDEQVSATAIVGEEGIGLDVAEHCRAFTQARWTDEALSIEIIGTAAWTVAQWLQRSRTIDHVVTLVADWCARHAIDPVWLNAGEVLEGRSGIVDHLVCNDASRLEKPSRGYVKPYSHTDIGALRFLVPDLLARVRGLLEPEVVTPPTVQEDDMATTARLYRHPRYHNVWLIGVGPALHLAPNLAASYTAQGITLHEEAHDQLLAACLAQSGLTSGDLAPR